MNIRARQPKLCSIAIIVFKKLQDSREEAPAAKYDLAAAANNFAALRKQKPNTGSMSYRGNSWTDMILFYCKDSNRSSKDL